MTRFGFYFSKISMLAHFVWWREWDLVREEWNLTYEQMLEARARFPEVEREAISRVLKD